MYEFSKEELLQAIQLVDSNSITEQMFLYGLQKELDVVKDILPYYIHPVVIPDNFNFDKKFDGKLYLMPEYKIEKEYEFVI